MLDPSFSCHDVQKGCTCHGMFVQSKKIERPTMFEEGLKSARSNVLYLNVIRELNRLLERLFDATELIYMKDFSTRRHSKKLFHRGAKKNTR